MTLYPSPNDRFSVTPELLGLTIGHLKSWRDLINISAVNELYRREAKTHIEILIRRLMSFFLGDEEQLAFWCIMEATLSIITGELPMALLLLDCIMGHILDIITPFGLAAQLVSFLVDNCGYHEDRNPPATISLQDTNSVCKVYYCFKATEKGNVWVIIREGAESDSLYTLLHQETTVDMNALTAHEVICMYPDATLARQAFYNERLGSHLILPARNDMYNRHQIQLFNVGDRVDRPCGIECGYLWRTTTHPDAVGHFSWRSASTVDHSLIHGMGHHHYKWRLGYMCSNYWCPRYRLPHPPGIQTRISISIEDVGIFPSQKINGGSLFFVYHVRIENHLYQEILLSDWNTNRNVSTTTLQLFREHFVLFMTALCDFFHIGQPTNFLNVLRHSNTIVSGSCALLALCPGTFLPNDLDLYTANEPTARQLTKFLQIHGYYRLIGTPDSVHRIHYESCLVDHVEFYYHRVDHRHVQVMYTSTLTPIASIFDLHTTAVMNCIAWYGVICTHPTMTLNQEGIRIQNNASACAAFSKYNQRGFRVRSQWKADKGGHSYHLNALDETNKFIMFLPLSDGNDVTTHLGRIHWMLPFRPASSRLARHGIVVTEDEDFGK